MVSEARGEIVRCEVQLPLFWRVYFLVLKDNLHELLLELGFCIMVVHKALQKEVHVVDDA